jgi:hypothetical protein
MAEAVSASARVAAAKMNVGKRNQCRRNVTVDDSTGLDSVSFNITDADLD